MKRLRFFRVIWGTLLLYEIMEFLLLELFSRHYPSGLSHSLAPVLLSLPVLAAILPLYLILSFMGILGRSRFVITIFFACFFVSAVFLLGTSLARGTLFIFPLRSSLDRWTLSEAFGFLIILIVLAVAIKGHFFSPQVYRETLRFSDLSADLSGMTVLHLSDLHVGSWQSDRSLQRIARTIEALSPEILVFTGDMIDHSEEEVNRFERIFGGLEGRIGTFAVLGNHEYWTLGARAFDVMKKAGVPVLRNEFRVVKRNSASAWIVGVDDPAGTDEGPALGPDPERAYQSVDPLEGDIVITLVHQPTLWDGKIKLRSQLTLAGHTHGGQMGRRRQRWSLARFFFLHDVGLFRSEEEESLGHYLHVSSGIGYYGVPLRIGMIPEMTLITLE